MNKNDTFIKHIEDHLKELKSKGADVGDGKVHCKICLKDIDTIYNESAKIEKTIVYVDGSCRGNPGPGIALAVFPGFDKREILNMTTNNQAEYTALILALKEILEEVNYLKEHDINKKLVVNIYTDSQLIVGHLTKGWKVNENIDLVDSAKRLLNIINEDHIVKIDYIPREKNVAGRILDGES